MLNRLAAYIDNLIAPPSWDKSVWEQIAYGAVECCICTTLVGLSYMYGLNLLLSPVLLSILYYRDVRAINDNSGYLHWDCVRARFVIMKFQVPFLISFMSVILIPFMLPVVIFASHTGSWNDVLFIIATSAIEHSSWFMSFYKEYPFLGTADRITFLSKMEKDIFILINSNSVIMIASGIVIGTIILFHNNSRKNIERMAYLFIRINGLSQHNYAYILSPLMYPLFISFLVLQTFGSSFHAHDVIFSSFMIIMLSCSVIQIVFLCSSGFANRRIR